MSAPSTIMENNVNLHLLNKFVGKKYDFYILYFVRAGEMCVIATDGSILCSVLVPVNHSLLGMTIGIPCGDLGKITMLSDPDLFISRCDNGYTIGVPGTMTLPLETIAADKVPNVSQIIGFNDVDTHVHAVYSLDYLRKIMDFCHDVDISTVCHTTAGKSKPICFSDPAEPSIWKIYLMPVEYKKNG